MNITDALLFAGLPQAGILDIFIRCNIAGKVLVAMLFVGSIFAWSIMITKMAEYRKAVNQSRRFLAAYQREPGPLSLMVKRQVFDGAPLYEMYRATWQELQAMIRGKTGGRELPAGTDPAIPALSFTDLRVLRTITEQAMDEQLIQLEKNVVVLATAVTAAPFIGLLGTVWGVMDAFAGLGLQGQSTLAQVGPGVAGSMITTIAGLVVALPSLIGYNILTSRLKVINTYMDHFSDRLVTDLERHYGRGG